MSNTNSLTSVYPPPINPDTQHGSGNMYSPGTVGGGMGGQYGYSPQFDPNNSPENNNGPAGNKITNGAGQTYGNIYGQAQGMAGYFSNAAANYNQQAPGIADVNQINQASDYYKQLMSGDGGYAQRQYQQGQDASIASQMAMANSARGGAAARVGAQRAAGQAVGAQTAVGANQAAQIASQEEQAGAAGMGQMGTLELQRGSQNAQLQQANQGQINQMQTALYGMGEQEQGLSLSAQQAYMANLLAAEGIQTQQSQFNTNLGVQIAGSSMQAAGGIIGTGGVSDEFAKEDIQPQGSGLTSEPAAPAAPAPSPLKPDQVNNSGQVQQGAGVGAASGGLTGLLTGGPTGAVTGAARGGIMGGISSAAGSHPNDPGLKLANAGTSAASGAASGAAIGSSFGPIGTAAGGIAGGIAGLAQELAGQPGGVSGGINQLGQSLSHVFSDARLKYDARGEGLTSVEW